eukprot:CCRYP_010306-RB/>CCRYP_010306-RB protein AED:0.06 eAED:0.09 QI:0/0.8/0.83/1/0.8/0.66/6/2888/71
MTARQNQQSTATQSTRRLNHSHHSGNSFVYLGSDEPMPEMRRSTSVVFVCVTLHQVCEEEPSFVSEDELYP